MNKIHFLNPQNLCGRAVLLGFTGACIGSIVFAIIDTIQLFTHEGSHSTFWLEYYLVIFIGSLLLTVIPLIIGSYFLAKILSVIKEKIDNRIPLIFLIGGVFGAILGLALCLFVGALIRFRMDLNIFLYRILVIELISFLIGGFIGRSTARI